MLRFITETVTRSLPLEASQSQLLRSGIVSAFAEGGLVEDCLPQVLEELAVPLYDGIGGVSGYRLLDGTFGDNLRDPKMAQMMSMIGMPPQLVQQLADTSAKRKRTWSTAS